MQMLPIGGCLAMIKYIYLNGRWRFTPVLDQRPENNHSLIQGTTPVYAYPELCRRDWEWVDVPGVWERYGEKYSIFEGICWYCREFEVDGITAGMAARLRFGGVNYRADVYINGQYVGWHESGYTEFVLDVTGFLRNGKNHIAVSVDNRPLIVKWPNDWGYFNYGGIHRDVTLELFEEDYIDKLDVTPDYEPDTGEALLTVSGTVRGGSGQCVSIQLDGKENRIQLGADGSFSETIRYSGLEAWTPEKPVCYEYVVAMGGCEYLCASTGFKRLSTIGGKLLLNGKPYRLNGCCYVYDSPKYGLVMAREQLLIDLGEMKTAGVNAIRTHYPMDQSFYSLCDEMGFLVWIEPNVYCSKPAADVSNTVFSRPEFMENAKNMLREMIAVARRFACVAIYGIGNECNVEHPEAMSFFRGLAAVVRETDSTRLVGYAALYGLIGDMGDLLDVIGINSYYGWYDHISDVCSYQPKKRSGGSIQLEHIDLSEFHKMIDAARLRLPKNLPILLTEFGGDSVPGYYSSAYDLWSEDYHAEVVREMIKASFRHDCINGTFVFAFTDYLDPSKPRNGFWNEFNLKGMLAYNRERKLPFYALQEVYGGLSSTVN